MDPNDDDHPCATNSLPLIDDDDNDDDDGDDSFTGGGFGASLPPSFKFDFTNSSSLLNSFTLPKPKYDNLEPTPKLKEVVLVMVEVTTPPNTANTIIPEEEAVCRFCFHQLFPVDDNNNNVMKTKCGCPFTLTHENCVIEWSGRKGNDDNNNNNKCDMCDQDVGYIRVTLSRASSISTKKEIDDKGSSSRSSSTLKKWSCFKTIS